MDTSMIKNNRTLYTKREVKLLLDTWKNMPENQRASGVSNTVKFGYISMVLSTYGYTRTWKQIEGKIKKLRKSFYSCYIHNIKYKSNEYKCKYYDELYELLGENAQKKFIKLRDNSNDEYHVDDLMNDSAGVDDLELLPEMLMAPAAGLASLHGLLPQEEGGGIANDAGENTLPRDPTTGPIPRPFYNVDDGFPTANATTRANDTQHRAGAGGAAGGEFNTGERVRDTPGECGGVAVPLLSSPQPLAYYEDTSAAHSSRVGSVAGAGELDTREYAYRPAARNLYAQRHHTLHLAPLPTPTTTTATTTTSSSAHYDDDDYDGYVYDNDAAACTSSRSDPVTPSMTNRGDAAFVVLSDSSELDEDDRQEVQATFTPLRKRRRRSSSGNGLHPRQPANAACPSSTQYKDGLFTLECNVPGENGPVRKAGVNQSVDLLSHASVPSSFVYATPSEAIVNTSLGRASSMPNTQLPHQPPPGKCNNFPNPSSVSLQSSRYSTCATMTGERHKRSVSNGKNVSRPTLTSSPVVQHISGKSVSSSSLKCDPRVNTLQPHSGDVDVNNEINESATLRIKKSPDRSVSITGAIDADSPPYNDRIISSNQPKSKNNDSSCSTSCYTDPQISLRCCRGDRDKIEEIKVEHNETSSPAAADEIVSSAHHSKANTLRSIFLASAASGGGGASGASGAAGGVRGDVRLRRRLDHATLRLETYKREKHLDRRHDLRMQTNLLSYYRERDRKAEIERDRREENQIKIKNMELEITKLKLERSKIDLKNCCGNN